MFPSALSFIQRLNETSPPREETVEQAHIPLSLLPSLPPYLSSLPSSLVSLVQNDKAKSSKREGTGDGEDPENCLFLFYFIIIFFKFMPLIVCVRGGGINQEHPCLAASLLLKENLYIPEERTGDG